MRYVLEEWGLLKKDLLQGLADSMQERCEQVIAAHGSPTGHERKVRSPFLLYMTSQRVVYFAILTGNIVTYALFPSIHRGEEKKGKGLRWVQVIVGNPLASHT